jgi:predicted DCC family thiol-disulfide oxidoreductase YuxK
MEPDTPLPIVLFDGVCNLCHASVNFILDRDPAGQFRFASLQSPTGQDLLRRLNLPTDKLSTVVLVEGDRWHTKSSAALRIAWRLKAPWPLLAVFLLVPWPLRNLVYDLIARNRYRWFGKNETCRLPTPSVRQRFLDGGEVQSQGGLPR